MRQTTRMMAMAAGVLVTAGAAYADDGVTALEDAAQPLVAELGEVDYAAMDNHESEAEGLRKWLCAEPREATPYDGFSRPITNINFHHPFIWNEVRPLFMYHNIPSDNALDGGRIQVHALQLHFAMNDWLQFTAYKDGYVDVDAGLLDDASGFADIAFGFKVKVWEDLDAPATAAVGLGYETKTGARDVLEGAGAGVFDLFGSYARRVDPVNLIATAGLFIPRDDEQDNEAWHWHVHADMPIDVNVDLPFTFAAVAEVNGFHYLSNGERNAGFGPTLPIGFEGLDYTTLGADEVDGHGVISGALGVRLTFSEDLSVGIAYERALSSREDVLDDRYTLDVVLRF